MQCMLIPPFISGSACSLYQLPGHTATGVNLSNLAGKRVKAKEINFKLVLSESVNSDLLALRRRGERQKIQICQNVKLCGRIPLKLRHCKSNVQKNYLFAYSKLNLIFKDPQAKNKRCSNWSVGFCNKLRLQSRLSENIHRANILRERETPFHIQNSQTNAQQGTGPQ